MANSKLAWMPLNADDARLPEDIRNAVAMLSEAREAVEDAVRNAKPAPKGRKWTFSYRYGVAIALSDAGNAATTSYFD